VKSTGRNTVAPTRSIHTNVTGHARFSSAMGMPRTKNMSEGNAACRLHSIISNTFPVRVYSMVPCPSYRSYDHMDTWQPGCGETAICICIHGHHRHEDTQPVQGDKIYVGSEPYLIQSRISNVSPSA
jgi:hypothetical protein